MIARAMVLSERPPAGWRGSWAADHGHGLNQELAVARAAIGPVPLLIIHGDLPLLAPDDVCVLLEAALRSGLALAPDRHGTGTNALAIQDGRPFAFSFGPDSFRQHAAQGEAAIVERPGLALDVDTAGDLDAAIAGGFITAIRARGRAVGLTSSKLSGRH